MKYAVVLLLVFSVVEVHAATISNNVDGSVTVFLDQKEQSVYSRARVLHGDDALGTLITKWLLERNITYRDTDRKEYEEKFYTLNPTVQERIHNLIRCGELACR